MDFHSFILFFFILGGALCQNTKTGTRAVHEAKETAKTLSPSSHVKGAAFDRIAFIWLENTNYAMALDDPNLAALAKQGIRLTNYFAQTHPSEPNYVASIGGDYFGMDNDNFNEVPQNISTVIDLLEDKKISWSEYQQHLPYSGFEGYQWLNQRTGADDYVRKHDPAVIYNSVAHRPDRLAKIKNFTLFYEDLKHDRLPQWMFITPNMTNDGHDTSVTVAGKFTRSFLEPLLKDPKFNKNTLVLVTFDENEAYPKQNKVLTLLLGDAVPKHLHGTTDDNYYNHYSEISTVEANWNLHTLGRFDVSANVFKFVAEKTGDKLQTWEAATGPHPTRFFNQSYAGLFNSYTTDVPIPKPNLNAVRNGRTVLKQIKEKWASDKKEGYYEDKNVHVPDGLNPPKGYAVTS